MCNIFSRVLLRLSLLITLFIIGCDNTDVTSYQIAKEKINFVNRINTPPSTPKVASQNQQINRVTWTAPADWIAQPASSMRKGSYLFKNTSGESADISIISFPGDAGGFAANVNRWRRQIQLPPLSEDEILKITKTTQTGNSIIFIIDFSSEQPILDNQKFAQVIGAILNLKTESWFFKISGDKDTVSSQRKNFHSFIQSIKVDQKNKIAGKQTQTAPKAPAPQSAGNTNFAKINYTKPENWQLKPNSPMRVASFKAVGPNNLEADISIVPLRGDSGGDLANINRWRRQIQLLPLNSLSEETSLEKIMTDSGEFTLVNLSNDKTLPNNNFKPRILAAIFHIDNEAWYFKMTGEDSIVTSQKSIFIDFLKSVSFTK